MIEKGEFFQGQDRYLYEPFEEAMFHWDHQSRTVYMKFLGGRVPTPVPYDHRIFNDAIRSGREITQAEFEAGAIGVA